MTEDELKSILDAHIKNSIGYVGGELSEDREGAMNYYLGEPFGNETEGRSSVVSRDVAEVIEWILPSLMRIFASGDKAVEFEPVGPEDEAQAKQETEYCNYVFYKKNPGFLILYSWFKDALLQKNGIVKTICEKKEENLKEEYENLPDEEYTMLVADPELEAKEHTERTEVFDVVLPDGQSVQLEELRHDVVFRRKRKSHDTKILNIPPEEFLISKDANSVNPKEADFTAHRSKKTYSDLIASGYKKSQLDKIGSEDMVDHEPEAMARKNLSDEAWLDSTSDETDKSMRRIWVYECYLRTDYDDDDHAELRRIVKAGDQILENEEVDYNCFAALTPIILTHKFFGLSIADLVMDLQLIKSTIWRQILDNLYINNNSRYAVDDENVNLDDLVTPRPGGFVRTKGPPMNSLFPLPAPALPGEVFNMMEYLDQIRETRTGVGKQFQGLNADTLKDANIPAVQGLLSAAGQRVEMIARIFAETGVKQLFKDIHELTRKYADKAEIVKLTNGWVPVDPREWRTQRNLTVSVGLGSSSRDSQMMAISSILADQEKIVASGGMGSLVSPKNIYNALVRKAEINGFKAGDEFFMDPDKAQPQPPKPDPKVIEVQLNAQQKQAELQQKQSELQFKAQDAAYKNQIAEINTRIELMKLKSEQDMHDDKMMLEANKQDVQAEIESLNQQLEAARSMREQALEEYKANLEATVRLATNSNKNVVDSRESTVER